MVEVTKQIFKDLSAELAKHQQELPKKIFLQFDNSGENKNKEMFFYLSLLIESHMIDEIYMSFLIVGHTHTILDQYFSVLAKVFE